MVDCFLSDYLQVVDCFVSGYLQVVDFFQNGIKPLGKEEDGVH